MEEIAAVVKSLQAESAAKYKELDELRLKDRQKELEQGETIITCGGFKLRVP